MTTSVPCTGETERSEVEERGVSLFFFFAVTTMTVATPRRGRRLKVDR